VSSSSSSKLSRSERSEREGAAVEEPLEVEATGARKPVLPLPLFSAAAEDEELLLLLLAALEPSSKEARGGKARSLRCGRARRG